MDDSAYILGNAGFILFTLGLIIGAVIPRLRNARMALSAHLTAVQSGLALMIFAVFWPFFGLPDWAAAPVGWSLTMSFYLLTTGITLAAHFGASKALPMAGEGFSSSRVRENLVSILTIGSSVWMLLTCLFVCFFLLTA
ncbi:hypothetical protein ACFOWX_10965 [Sphingorhabdus arenilitoris]|uniref:Hydrogenase n=1 Tax=Sphingorhabdus arenilitoris TaxID=1490041 RepID=A0ABV8RHQ3_9SPHN